MQNADKVLTRLCLVDWIFQMFVRCIRATCENAKDNDGNDNIGDDDDDRTRRRSHGKSDVFGSLAIHCRNLRIANPIDVKETERGAENRTLATLLDM